MNSDRFRVITAKFDGRCPECEERFEAGDQIMFDTQDRKAYCLPCGEDLSE